MPETGFSQLMAGIPHLSLEELESHPRLAEARRLYIDKFLAVYGGDQQLSRLLIASARYLVFTIVMVLNAAQDPARPETLATVGRLKQFMLGFGMASPRQIDSVISRLRDVGFLEVVRSEHDGRVHILRPTEAAMAHDRDYLVAHYEPLAFLYPHKDYSGIMRRDPAFHVRHRCIGMEFLPSAVGLLGRNPEFMVFFMRDGGYMFLAAILQAAANSADGTHAAVSYADVGERFGYSRTHVRQVLKDAQAAGLVRLHGRGGHKVEVLPQLWAGHDRGIATGMYLNDMVYAKTATRPASSS